MKRGRFPQRIKRGSCVVTIYRAMSKGYSAFTVAHYDAKGKLCRRTFADFKQARKRVTRSWSRCSWITEPTQTRH